MPHSNERRVVVTGMGLVSCLGNDLATVSTALRESLSGIRFVPEYAELGLRSQVAGVPDIDLAEQIDRKLKRFMGDAAGYAYVATRDAIAMAGLDDEEVRAVRTGLIAGSGGASPQWQIETHDGVDGFRSAVHVIRHPRPQLFDFRRLRDIRALHRCRRGSDPLWCQGHDAGRRR